MIFSIVIPVYNVEDKLERCISSVLRQTVIDYEIILIDDGSTDRSGIMCDEYKEKDSRIVVVHKENGGLSSARNKGIDIARGDYVIFLDSDDYVEERFCEVISKTIKDNNPDIVAVDMVFERNGRIKERSVHGITPCLPYDGEHFLNVVINNTSFNAEACANVCSLKFWRNNNFSFADIYHEDLEIAIGLFLAAKKVVYCQGARYHAVARDGSIMNDALKAKKRHSDLLNIISKWFALANDISNKELSRTIKGVACRTFIYSCAHNNIKSPEYSVVGRGDIIHYALNVSDLIKGISFIFVPGLYCYFWKRKHL